MAEIKPTYNGQSEYLEDTEAHAHEQANKLGEPTTAIIADSNKYADIYAEALERYPTDESIDPAAEKALKR